MQDEQGFLWDYGVHITFSHNYPYYDQATKWAVDEWNQIQRNGMADMSHIFGEKGLHLVPYPAQFAVPLFPEDIKQKCFNELVERYKNVGGGIQSFF